MTLLLTCHCRRYEVNGLSTVVKENINSGLSRCNQGFGSNSCPSNMRRACASRTACESVPAIAPGGHRTKQCSFCCPVHRFYGCIFKSRAAALRLLGRSGRLQGREQGLQVSRREKQRDCQRLEPNQERETPGSRRSAGRAGQGTQEVFPALQLRPQLSRTEKTAQQVGREKSEAAGKGMVAGRDAGEGCEVLKFCVSRLSDNPRGGTWGGCGVRR